mgnify:FL=1
MSKTSDLSYRELAENFYASRSEKDYNVLYKKVKPGLKSYIFNIIKDSEATGDVLANTLTKLWTKIDQYKPEYQVTTWLYKIAFNECLSHIRKRNRKYSLDAMRDYGIEVTEGNHTTNMADNLLLDSEERMTEADFYEEDEYLQNRYESAIECINSLKPMYREIMQDRLFHNMKYEDIAEKYNVSLQTVKNRVRRGKVLIQRAMGE